MKIMQGGKMRHLDTRTDIEKEVEAYLEMIPAALELYAPQAKALKKKYDSLVAEGFTSAQAMDLVKTRPIFE